MGQQVRGVRGNMGGGGRKQWGSRWGKRGAAGEEAELAHGL